MTLWSERRNLKTDNWATICGVRWKAFGDLLGWQLKEWSYETQAQFTTGTETITISKRVYLDIMKAIE